jgi:hypothetical protein
VRNPRPFTVSQPIPARTSQSRSLAQAHALVAAKVAGETIVVGPV